MSEAKQRSTARRRGAQAAILVGVFALAAVVSAFSLRGIDAVEALVALDSSGLSPQTAERVRSLVRKMGLLGVLNSADSPAVQSVLSDDVDFDLDVELALIDASSAQAATDVARGSRGGAARGASVDAAIAAADAAVTDARRAVVDGAKADARLPAARPVSAMAPSKITAAVINAVSAQRTALQRCYERRLAQEPFPKSNPAYQIDFTSDGSVTGVTALLPDNPSEDVRVYEACVRRVLSHAQTAAPLGYAMRVTVPLAFRPGR